MLFVVSLEHPLVIFLRFFAVGTIDDLVVMVECVYEYCALKGRVFV